MKRIGKAVPSLPFQQAGDFLTVSCLTISCYWSSASGEYFWLGSLESGCDLCAKMHAETLKAAMLRQRLVASWRLLGEAPIRAPEVRPRAGGRIARNSVQSGRNLDATICIVSKLDKEVSHSGRPHRKQRQGAKILNRRERGGRPPRTQRIRKWQRLKPERALMDLKAPQEELEGVLRWFFGDNPRREMCSYYPSVILIRFTVHLRSFPLRVHARKGLIPWPPRHLISPVKTSSVS